MATVGAGLSGAATAAAESAFAARLRTEHSKREDALRDALSQARDALAARAGELRTAMAKLSTSQEQVRRWTAVASQRESKITYLQQALGAEQTEQVGPHRFSQLT